MAKRRREKAKAKSSAKEKAVKPSNSAKNVSDSQESADSSSPSSTKKPKLDSSQSPGTRRSNRYVPPFTASQRVITLRRNRVITCEQGEETSNSQGSSGVEDGSDVSKNNMKNLDENSQQEKDNITPIESVDKEQDVLMEFENAKGKESKTETNISETTSGCSSSQKQTGTDDQIQNGEVSGKQQQASYKNSTFSHEMHKEDNNQVTLHVPRLAELAKQFCELGEETKKGRNVVETATGSSDEGSNKRMTAAQDAKTTSILDAYTSRMSGLQTLADTCAEIEHVDAVLVETESSQNELQNTRKKGAMSLSRKKKDSENKKSDLQNLENEKALGGCNEDIRQHNDVFSEVTVRHPSHPGSSITTENRNVENLSKLKITSSKDAHSEEAKNSSFSEAQNTASKHTSSGEVIREKLSEILSVVCEMNKLAVSGTKCGANLDRRAVTDSEKMDKPPVTRIQKCRDVNSNDQQVPEKIISSPGSSKEKGVSDLSKGKANQNSSEAHTGNGDEAIAVLSKTSEDAVTDNFLDRSKNISTSCTSNTVDEQTFAREFEELEELLPEDDMELFNDVIMSEPKNTSLEKDLPDGDRTIEFLINELDSLHCIVANYERAVQDINRNYMFNVTF